MTRVPLGARDVAWATACGLLLLAQFAPADWRPAVPDDTRSAAADGQKALALIAERSGYDVARREAPLPGLAEDEAPADTLLVILGPPRDLTDEENEALTDWIVDGGGVLFASRRGRTVDFGFGRIAGGASAGAADDGDAAGEEGEEEDGTTDAEDVREELAAAAGGGLLRGGKPSTAAGLEGAGLALFWPYGGVVTGAGGIDRPTGADGAPEDAGALIVVDGGVRAARTRTWNGGTAVLAAGAAGFSNRSLAWGDNAALAFRLLELAAEGRRRVVFDESLNLTGTPKTVALLLDPELRPLTLHLCLLAALWGWWRGRAFGPPLPDPDPPRRTLTDHTDAAGDLAWRTGDGAGVVGWYRRALARDLRIPADPALRAKRAEALAAAAGRDPAEVTELFARLGRVDARTKPGEPSALKRRAAAALIRELARLRADVGHVRR